MIILGIFQDMWDAITSGFIWLIRVIGAGICSLIYGLISTIYQVFMTVSRLNILSEEYIQPIYQRITLILTIVMVFYITFEFVKYVVQPDQLTDKEKGAGNIIIKMILVIILIAFVPRIFTLAYDLQNRVITTQVFSKIILGREENNYQDVGDEFSTDMFELFYKLDDEACSVQYDQYGNMLSYSSSCEDSKKAIDETLERMRSGNFNKIETGSVSVNNNKVITPINFDGLMALIVGGIIGYILVMYCVDVGARYAQLVFLQIISPIAIMGYISPKKDGIFQKWLKQCITTYLDLFIRLAIINFVLLVIVTLKEAYATNTLFAGIEGLTVGVKTLSYIILVIGLLMFALKAPQLLQELFPSGGAASLGFGLSPKKRFGETFGLAKNAVSKTWNAGKRTVGGVGGALAGGYNTWKNRKDIGQNYGNAFTRFLGVGYSGLRASYRGLKAGAGKGGSYRAGTRAAHEAVERDIEIADQGGTAAGHDFRGEHYRRQQVETKRTITALEETTKVKSEIKTQVEDTKLSNTSHAQITTWENSGEGTSAARTDAQKKIDDAMRIYSVARTGPGGEPAARAALAKVIDDQVGNVVGVTIQRDANGQEIGRTHSNAKLTEIQAKVAATQRIIEEINDLPQATLTEEQKVRRTEATKSLDQLSIDRTVEIARMDAEVARVTALLKGKIDGDGAAIDKVQIKVEEGARRISGQTYQKEVIDANGRPRIETVTVSVDNIIDFASDLSIIEETASRTATAIKADRTGSEEHEEYDYRRTEANANTDGGSGSGS